MANYKIILLGIISSILVMSCKVKSYLNSSINSHNDPYLNYTSYKKVLRKFESKDGNMTYLDEGEGPVILLMHGVPTSSWLYRKIIPQLLSNGFRVIAPDMLGYGGSDKPNGYAVYSSYNMAQRTLALMEHLGIGNWSQVFHDGGGLWTWEMLEMAPAKVNHLFMLNTIVYEEGFKPPLRLKEGLIAGLFSRLYTSKGGQILALNTTFKNGVNDKSVVTDAMLEGYKNPFLNEGHGAIYYFFTQTSKPLKEYLPLHRNLNIPTTVIWGGNDVMLVWDDIANKVKRNFNLSDDDVHILNAKHFVQEERPDEIAKIIVEQLN